MSQVGCGVLDALWVSDRSAYSQKQRELLKLDCSGMTVKRGDAENFVLVVL